MSTSLPKVKPAPRPESAVIKFAIISALIGMAPATTPVLVLIDARMIWALRRRYDARLDLIDTMFFFLASSFVAHLIFDVMLTPIGLATLGMAWVAKGVSAFAVTACIGRYASRDFQRLESALGQPFW